MIGLGGRAILAGEMTLGDLVMYIFFIGLVAAPLVSIASIGTQITEAFAGLDRIRELLDMATEDAEDEQRAGVSRLKGDVAFEHVWFEYEAGRPVLRDVSFDARGRHDHGARRVERLGQEHADQPGDGVQPAHAGPHPHRRAGPGRPAAGRLPPPAGVGAAGELPLRRHHRRQRRLRQARRHAATRSSRRAAWRTATSSSRSSPTATTPWSASAASSCRADSASASRLRARSWPARAC